MIPRICRRTLKPNPASITHMHPSDLLYGSGKLGLLKYCKVAFASSFPPHVEARASPVNGVFENERVNLNLILTHIPFNNFRSFR